MSDAKELSAAPAGPEALLAHMNLESMDRFEAAVIRSHTKAIQERELAQAQTDKPTICQRRLTSADTEGKRQLPPLPAMRARSIPVAALAQQQADEYGEFSVKTRLSLELQAKIHGYPVNEQRKAWNFGKKRGLINDAIPYAKYMESSLAFIGPVPISGPDPPSFPVGDPTPCSKADLQKQLSLPREKQTGSRDFRRGSYGFNRGKFNSSQATCNRGRFSQPWRGVANYTDNNSNRMNADPHDEHRDALKDRTFTSISKEDVEVVNSDL